MSAWVVWLIVAEVLGVAGAYALTAASRFAAIGPPVPLRDASPAASKAVSEAVADVAGRTDRPVTCAR